MSEGMSDFRDLHDRLADYEGREVVREIVEPWIAESDAERQELNRFLALPANAEVLPSATGEDLWRLYALSRVTQFLILRFQPWLPGTPQFQGLNITVPEYAEAMARLGMATRDPEVFHPFDCEVVSVEQADDPTQPPELIDIFWPCVTAGPLLIERAGVAVYAGRNHLIKSVAEQSTLYWAYRRKNRPYQDESHGWGSNSQWRTAFRRDYRFDRVFHYNVDGKLDPRVLDPADPDWPPGDLTVAERVELLTHRCFVRTVKPHDDLYPYRDTLRVG